MSKSEVSRICQGLDEQVDALERTLPEAYPHLWLDAKVQKVRDGGRVVRKALVLTYAVHKSGYREVIGLDVGESRDGSFWRASCARWWSAASRASSSSSHAHASSRSRMMVTARR